MLLEPRDLYEKLEFDKVLKLLEENCLGELGVAQVHLLAPLEDKKSIQDKLKAVDEYKIILEHNEPFPARSYEDISDDLRMLSLEGYVLSEEALKRINIILRQIYDTFTFFHLERQKTYPTLHQIIRAYNFDANLITAIEKVIDEEGNIRPDASPALAKIRRSIGAKERELDRVFKGLIGEYRRQGWLTDNVETFRNSRRVLSVPVEHKRKIRGIIHDESTTGKTAFIEPEQVIDINNDIFDFYTEEKREIYRILKDLSETLRPYAPKMYGYVDIIVAYDVIQAKARLARQMRAVMPRLTGRSAIHIEMGYHPLLYLKNKNLFRETIPFDLVLQKDKRVLLLSGPNAGGKSVTMKAVGLMQLMVQAGLLVPVDETSEFGIFDKIFADIGDQQSLEDDLSTYSSRLKNMKAFLDHADSKTLVLIDEFGSGTDPQIGGAIAEAILDQFNQKKSYGVITTHYSNLKIYAFKTEGILNGSMLYDKDNFAPTYRLKVGRPGSSYAFEIAEKSGLNEEILDYAKHRTGRNEKAVDQLLIDLQREKQELEERLRIAEERANKLEKLIRNYEYLQQDLEFRRKKVKLDAKEQSLQKVNKENRELEKLIREIKEEKNLEKAKELAAQVRSEREQVVEEVTQLQQEIYYQPEKKEKRKQVLKKGDFVRMKMGSATGNIESMDGNFVMVQMGMMRMRININDLELVNEPLDIRHTRTVFADTVEQVAKFSNKLDIRGMRLEEAVKTVEDFLDQALVSNADSVRILHGKGSGALRNAVKAKLREYDAIKNISHPAEDVGGNGVTIAKFS